MKRNIFLKNSKVSAEKENSSVEQYFHINDSITKNEKIDLEKRRRYQLYSQLDYLLSLITYFDFFNLEVIKILKNSKQIAEFFNKNFVTSEDLFFSIFYSNSNVLELFEKNNLSKDAILDNIENSFKKNKSDSLFKNIFNELQKILQFNKIKKQTDYAFELNILFEKVTNNTIYRFKTPVITTEILLLTLLETNNNSKILKVIKTKIGNELNWYLFKYKLIKRIHKEESKIREEINKNQQFFAYLLKTQLSDLEFDQLLKENLLESGVSLFRNTLVSQILQINFLEKLKKDINSSIRITNKRKYSK